MNDTSRNTRFSFLTTAYKTEQYLAETIDSVLAQTSPEWELVVVDNGNSDAIAAIVRSYATDGRVRLVRQENKGYSGGVMAAADVARGDYFCVLDSDDLLMPTFVETIGAFIDSHPDADAVGCDAHQFVDGERRSFGRGYLHSIGVSRRPQAGDRITVDDVLGGLVPYYVGAIRRQAWDMVGGYEPGVAEVEEDVVAWLRLAAEFHVFLLPDRLARSRLREGSVSHDPQKIESFERRLIRAFELFARESGRPEHLVAVEASLRRLRYHQALRRARWSFLDGDFPAARRFARDAYNQKHTLRAVAVVSSVTIAPRLLSTLHPLKQRLAVVARRMLSRAQP